MSVYKKWLTAFFVLLAAALVLLGGITAIIDPYFHYHAPIEGLSYNIFFQRYQNHGIVKNFEYDTVITGNSMVENFKTSQCDELFSANTVKVPFSGASLKELDSNLRSAFRHNDGIKRVIMGLDYGSFIQDKDYMAYSDSDYPDFLYDDNIFNDVKYLFNKSILKTSLDVLVRSRAGVPMTSFDEYSAWPADTMYGREVVFAYHQRHWLDNEKKPMTQERLELLRGNISQNLLETARANPDTEFYYYFPPYSILFWDKQQRMGTLELTLEAEKEVIDMLLELDNVHLFSFLDDFELICDFSRYKDYIHHDPNVNSYILGCMASGEHELTEDNLDDYLLRMQQFYTNYDYDALYQ